VPAGWPPPPVSFVLIWITQHIAGAGTVNTGQTLLSIGALVLLGSVIVSANRSSLQHGVILQQTEIGVYAVSLAIGRIEEATGKSFDEFTAPDDSGDTDTATSLTQLTSTLGPESGEVYPDFDDIDDFNNLTTTVYIAGVDTMRIHSTVAYVSPSNPDLLLTTRTWHKKLTVYVTGSATRDTVRISSIFSYWWFR
jgi:hypothetical protein